MFLKSRTAFSPLKIILSHKTTWFNLLFEDSYSAVRYKKSCLTFQLNRWDKSVCRSNVRKPRSFFSREALKSGTFFLQIKHELSELGARKKNWERTPPLSQCSSPHRCGNSGRPSTQSTRRLDKLER